jgi:hypothetical protein
MRDITRISHPEFRRCLKDLSFGTIKQLIEVICNLCCGNIADSLLYDLQRKETMLWGELQSRGYDLKNFEFTLWRSKLKPSKRIF